MKATRYAGIANALRDRIRKGDYPCGCALPSQKELASRFGTTVMTVRQALSVLQREGLLRASHGVGTFVASGGVKGRDLRLRGLADSIRGARGQDPDAHRGPGIRGCGSPRARDAWPARAALLLPHAREDGGRGAGDFPALLLPARLPPLSRRSRMRTPSMSG